MPEIRMMFDANGNETKDPQLAVRLDIQQVDENDRLLNETIFFQEVANGKKHFHLPLHYAESSFWHSPFIEKRKIPLLEALI